MKTCEACGSTYIVVKEPFECGYVQRPDGTWTDQGIEDVGRPAVWYCGDCDTLWKEWFTEAVRR